ncbi:hypothetical protein [Actinomadura sp. NEAU-AAG7]|uniref:hypothetical protein n=1 Tax=Actinomadura sp. NEAU-AAG7 TaxID=2839640 RepID=UPI001BE473DE|nr:hypothetical protein [Actinomadura sp. NEAU-AAG7]MBT2206895.1 hypothetical protein [Actinomadura sp. NEAU-AAG7]
MAPQGSLDGAVDGDVPEVVHEAAAFTGPAPADGVRQRSSACPVTEAARRLALREQTQAVESDRPMFR